MNTIVFMSVFEIFLIGQCMTATALTLWFRPRTPIHLFLLLRKLGWRQGRWSVSESDMRLWTRTDFEMWSAISLPPFWAELLSCPYCLGTHFSLWISIFLCLVCGAPWWFIIAGTFGWGGLANLILKKQ